MNDYRVLASDLMSSLELSLPPIAISFCSAVPAGVASFDRMAPAGCWFWQEAAASVFGH